MPIQKNPVEYKFGIISSTHQVELQKQILLKSQVLSSNTKRKSSPRDSTREATEQFVKAYNEATDNAERDKLQTTALRLLEKLKRKTGLKNTKVRKQIDLPSAWTELTQLAQCKGIPEESLQSTIQQESLDILMLSLDQASFDFAHIPALFFLAEFVLYWLRTDVSHAPFLTKIELRLLQLGHLVFARLFCHHMSGHLLAFIDLKKKLSVYLNGFSDCQEIYGSFPNALCCVHYIRDVGDMIINSEAKLAPQTAIQTRERTVSPVPDKSISSSIHRLSPSLWHSLDVWRSVDQLSPDLYVAINSLANCSSKFSSENWLDTVLALEILGEAAKLDLGTLTTLQYLACEFQSSRSQYGLNELSKERLIEVIDYQSSKILPTIQEASQSGSAVSSAVSDKENKSLNSTRKNGINTELSLKEDLNTEPVDDVNNRASPRISPRITLQTSGQTESAGMMSTSKTFSNSIGADSMNLDVTKSSNVSEENKIRGMSGWNWRVAVKYVDVMSDICLNASTSKIRRQALLGHQSKASHIHIAAQEGSSTLSNAGLLELVYFNPTTVALGDQTENWSWMVRHAALLGILRICHCTRKDPALDSLKAISFSEVVHARHAEKDLRVIEALKVAEIDVNRDNLSMACKGGQQCVATNTFGRNIAEQLAAIYLPNLPPPIAPAVVAKKPKRAPSPKKKVAASSLSSVQSFDSANQVRSLRTTVGEEIILAANTITSPSMFQLRSSQQLQDIIDDQWRKELQMQMEQEREKQDRVDTAKDSIRDSSKSTLKQESKQKLKKKAKTNKPSQ